MDNQTTNTADSISSVNRGVFDKISDLVTSTDFQHASFQFLDKHKELFSDDDENKLEYTTIHEDYVLILEQIIDSKLIVHFEQTQIQDFYDDFMQNFEMYAKINNDTVETLFGFTDFNKFKKLIIDIKNGTLEQNLSQKNMDDSNVSKAGEKFFWDLYKEDHNDKSLGWVKKMDHKSGINYTAWQRPEVQSGDIISRAEIYYNNIKMETIVHYFQNFQKYHEKRENIVEEKFVEVNDDGSPALIYTRFKLPLMSERETLIRIKMERLTCEEHKGKVILYMYSVEDPVAYPIKKNAIRVQVFNGLLIEADGDSTRGLQFQTFNMGGYFPMRLLNMAIGTMVKKQTDKSYQKLLGAQKELEAKENSQIKA